ncbi:hypothetical protein ACP4OV_000990 [Aristida adscensionis]
MSTSQTAAQVFEDAVEVTQVTRKSRKRSAVWNHFEELPPEGKNHID